MARTARPAVASDCEPSGLPIDIGILSDRCRPRKGVLEKRENQPSAPFHRLNFIEGLRGYLALWVVVCHVLWACGLGPDVLSGIPKLLRMGEYAVDVFIIVSGFVIFLLLDTQRSTYTEFVVRRFCRLFPLFITLFAIAIPLSLLSLWNTAHAAQFLTADQAQTFEATLRSWWRYLDWHIPLHATMLHGAIPSSLVPNAPGAFLIPAWSVSLEWQFYLVAPLAYAMAVSSRLRVRIALVGICLVLYVAARTVLPPVDYGAALPFHIEYFFIGVVSYFIYKRRPQFAQRNVMFLAGCVVSAILLFNATLSWTIPTGLWILFMGALLERPSAISSLLAAAVFTNPISLHLGRISYSVYLSHILVITALQFMLLAGLPQLTLGAHFAVLLVSAMAVTVAVSTVLHRWVEVPGINLGRTLARKLSERRAIAAPAGDDIATTGRWHLIGQRLRRRRMG